MLEYTCDHISRNEIILSIATRATYAPQTQNGNRPRQKTVSILTKIDFILRDCYTLEMKQFLECNGEVFYSNKNSAQFRNR